MADRVIFNSDELDALWGLPLLAQVVYFRGIRPEMDYQTGLVGVRTSRTKKISYQSISEAVEVHPHQGRTGAGKPSRGELRAAVGQLVKMGLVEVLSESTPSNRQLIFKCVLADVGYSVQKKDDTFTTIKTTGLQPETQPVYDQEESTSESNNCNGFDGVDSEGKPQNTTSQSAETQQTESQKHDTPRSTENKHTDTTRAGARGAELIPDGFCIDAEVSFRLKTGGVSQEVAEYFLNEFKAANESSGFCSMNWAAEFVKYCHRWKWRFEKEQANGESQQFSQKAGDRASRAHERDRRLYEEALAEELGDPNLHEVPSQIRSQVVVFDPRRRGLQNDDR